MHTYVSRDYNQFRLDTANRPIDPNHVRALVRSIRKRNWLSRFPIVVDRTYLIKDGQHRFMAAQEQDEPIFYQFEDELDQAEMSLDDVAQVNSATKQWKLRDFLHSFVERGYPEYVTLNDFMEREGFAFTQAFEILADRGMSREASEWFRTGQFKCTNPEKSEQLVQWIKDFEERGVTFARTRAFVRTLRYLRNHPLYDHDRMMRKLESRRLLKTSNVEDYLVQFEEVYNFYAQKRVRLTPQ